MKLKLCRGSLDWEIYTRLAEMLRQTWPTGKKTQDILDDLRQD